MAVEARHLNPFPPQLIQNSQVMNAGCAYNTQNLQLLVGGVALPENHQPFYPPVKTESGLPRKRSRDQLYGKPNGLSELQYFGGEDILPQFERHQLEIDAIISQHMKKIRFELEERQKQQTKLLASAIGQGVVKILKEKDDQIQRMGKLNLLLQQRLKSLYVENQLLRDLAQTNEATANSLRTNLEQVLLQQVAGEDHPSAEEEEEEEVASCCGSIDEAEGGRRAEDVAESGQGRCRKCGDRESSVLLLPCRHLCLCHVCGSGSHQVQACPVCHCRTNATLHVNLSA